MVIQIYHTYGWQKDIRVRLDLFIVHAYVDALCELVAKYKTCGDVVVKGPIGHGHPTFVWMAKTPFGEVKSSVPLVIKVLTGVLT